MYKIIFRSLICIFFSVKFTLHLCLMAKHFRSLLNAPRCQVFFTNFCLSFFFPLSPLCHDRWKGALIIPEGWEINDCLWSRPGPWTTLEAKHVICNCWSKTFTLLQKKKEKWGGWLLGKRKWYLCLLPFVYQGILSHFPPFFSFLLIHFNGFQTGKWKCCSCPLFRRQRPGNRAIFYHQG